MRQVRRPYDQKIEKGGTIMPKGDRTGPMGTGARSGRAAGFCAGFEMPGYANTPISGGLGMGRRRRLGGGEGPMAEGRGWRHRYFSTERPGHRYFANNLSPVQPAYPELEKDYLRNRSQALQSELDAINKRLGEMESRDKTP